MTWLKRIATILTLAFILAMPLAASACPACREAVAAGGAGADEEYINAPLAYNQSIYLMVGAPYLSLGVVSFMIYRGCKKNAAFREALENANHSGNA